MITQAHISVAIFSLLFYSSLNIFCSKIIAFEKSNSKLFRDHIGQYISLIHSVIACILALYFYISNNGLEYESDFSFKYIVVVGNTIGYLIYDMIYAEIFALHDLAMRFHHICGVIGGLILYLQDNSGSIGAFCIALTELSNPFMQARLILKGRQETETFLYKISEILFVIIFTVNRGILGSFLNYNVYQYEGVHTGIKIFVSLLYGVSVYWIYVITLMIAKKVKDVEKPGLAMKYFFRIVNSTRDKNKIVIAVIFSWALVMPIFFKSLGAEKFHLKVFDFSIV